MFIAVHTPKCHDITRLISQSMDHPLALRARFSMRIHYLICAWCERYRDQLLFLRQALRTPPRENANQAGGTLSADARARLKIAMQPET